MPRNYRHPLLAAVAALTPMCVAPFAIATESVVLIDNGRPQARIVVADGTVRAFQLANELNTYLQASTGATLPISFTAEVDPSGEDRSASADVQLHLGNTPWVAQNHADLGNLHQDGFVLDATDVRHIVLTSPTDDGLAFGVYDLLEQAVGVRWLFPGDVGTHVPQRTTIAIPATRRVEQPAFTSRLLSDPRMKQKGSDADLWSHKLRMKGHINFHHNLIKLFPPETYGQTHPDFYPLVDGKRFLPEKGNWRWQPNLLAPGITEEAIANIKQFFADNPEEGSYSLGMNDSGIWDPSVRGEGPPRLNSLGFEDLSDYYFTWTNKVVKGVTESYPDKLFGCIAYRELTDPPSAAVSIDPRMVPFMCFERSQWADPAYAEKDRKLTRQWAKIAPNLGWYDYVYGGTFFDVPHYYPHLIGEYLRFASENNVTAYYGEIYTGERWANGPQYYVLLKLLWDPTLDADTLVREWCETAVGPDAADALVSYFAFWEDFWTNRVPGTAWFNSGGQIFLPFKDRSYLDALRLEDVEQARLLIDRMVSAAPDSPYRERAAFIAQGFAGVEAVCREYVRFKELAYATDSQQNDKLIASFAFTPDPSASGKALPQGWSSWRRDHSQSTMHWDRQVGHDTPGSLRIDVNDVNHGPAIFMHYLDEMTPGALYRVTLKTQRKGLDAKAVVGLETRWQDEATGGRVPGDPRPAFYLQADAGSDSWHTLAGVVRAPENKKPGHPLKMQLILSTVGSQRGSVYFDDVQVTRLDPE